MYIAYTGRHKVEFNPTDFRSGTHEVGQCGGIKRLCDINE